MENIFKITLGNRFKITLGVFLCFVLVIIMILQKEINYFSMLIIIGCVLNFICVFSNGMKMPVRDFSNNKLKKTHKLLTNKTKFPYLADIFIIDIVGEKYTRRLAFSVGDFSLYMGLILSIITIWR